MAPAAEKIGIYKKSWFSRFTGVLYAGGEGGVISELADLVLLNRLFK